MNENENKIDIDSIDIVEALSMGTKKEVFDNTEVQRAIDEAKKAGYVKGVKVKHIADNEVGEIVGYNRKINGDNPGDKYPVTIKFERGRVSYGIKSLEIVK